MLSSRAGRLARTHWPMLLLLTGAMVVYTWRLSEAPFAVANDEAHFSAHGYALATTGRDLSGTWLPLFVDMIDPLVPEQPGTARWQPLLFYLTGLSLMIFPMSEWAIRLPVVIVGMISVALIYAITFEVFRNRAIALVSAAMMALTPGLFIMSRQAIDYLCPVPFVLGWLWCLARYFRDSNARYLAAAGAVLGFGAWSHIAGWALAPLFGLVTLVVLLQRHALRVRPVAAFTAGALVPLGLTIAWLWFHPGVTRELFDRYGLVAGTPMENTFAVPLERRFSIYWDYFNPSFLFFAGGAHPTQATSRAGVFLLPLAPLIPLGLHGALMRARPATPAIVWGFVLAPMPVVLIMGALGEYSIGRAITLMPFGILVAAHGVDWLWHSGPSGRVALGVLGVMMPIQFALFSGEYFSDYQIRTAYRFDRLNTRAVADFAIAYEQHTAIPAIFLSDDGHDSKSLRWRFHLWKAHHEELWDRTRYYGTPPWGSDDVPVGSLLVFYAADARAAGLLASGDYDQLAALTQPSGDPASIVLRKNR